jgi:ABC-type multidrug transport system fused ATPase/permease subunit
MVTVGINASREMHRQLLTRVINAPVSFFDTTPLGRILNRFSSDVTQTDERLGYTIGWVVGIVANVLGIIGTISYTTNGLFLVVVPFFGIVYYRVQLFFRKTNTELKRLENISRSPIYTDFQEMLSGVTSLRAFKAQMTVIRRMEKRLDQNTCAMILQNIVTWWLNIRLDMISGCTSFFVAALAAGDPTFIPLEYLGLSLQQSFSLTGFMKMVVNQFAAVEAMMSSVERIKYYTENIAIEEPLIITKSRSRRALKTTAPSSDLEQESKAQSENNDFSGIDFVDEATQLSRFAASSPPQDWPTEGRIEFRNVSMRYRDGPLVLKNFNATIRGNEKIGKNTHLIYSDMY